MKFNLFTKKPKVTISNINVKWQGSMHQLDGMDIKERVFEFTMPFKNKTHADLLTEAAGFKAEKAKPMVIKGIDIAAPFKLLSVEPAMPATVNPDEKIDIKMKIEAPDYAFTGAMNVSLLSDTVEVIHVEIQAVILNYKGKNIEVETSSRILPVQKGQIFPEKVQMYKAMSFGDRLTSVAVEPPFKLVSTDPKLPFAIDDPNSYIATFYIQAPETSFAGKLIMNLS